MTGSIAKPTSIIQLRMAAYKFREIMGLENRLYFPVVQFIEWILPVVLDFDFEILDVSEMPPQTYAFTVPDKKIMYIRKDVYEAACKGQGRARFTLVHEIGHLLFHTEENIMFARSDQKIPAYSDPEWQANTFAAELLIPKNMVQGMSIDDVVEKCGVSRQCAEIQMRKYGFLK